MVKILNRIGEDENANEIQNHLEVANRVLKITGSKNISDLVRILFNTLTAFDALKGYVLNELENCKFAELVSFIKTFKKLLTAKCIDANKDFDLGKFLHDVRNTYLHSGVFFARLEFIPSGQANKVVPSIAIQVNKIWKAEYLEKINLADDYVIDTLEVLENYQKLLREINIDDIFEFHKIKMLSQNQTIEIKIAKSNGILKI